MPEIGPALSGVYNNKGGSGAGEQAGHERAEKIVNPCFCLQNYMVSKKVAGNMRYPLRGVEIVRTFVRTNKG